MTDMIPVNGLSRSLHAVIEATPSERAELVVTPHLANTKLGQALKHNTREAPIHFLTPHNDKEKAVHFLPKHRLNTMEEIQAIEESIKHLLPSGEFTSGAGIAELEKQLSAFTHIDHFIATSSGTMALTIALLAVGVKAGDDVLLNSNSFAATENAVLAIGAKPRLVDTIVPGYTMDPESLKTCINANTKAVIFTGLYGSCEHLQTVANICRQYDIALIEDACQAIGCDSVGQFSDLAAFSFNPYKNFGVCGKAGAIATGNQRLAEQCRMLSYHGFAVGKKNEKQIPFGYNAQIDNLQAVVALAKLPFLSFNNLKRKIAAHWYIDNLSALENDGLLTLPKKEQEHAWHLFTLQIETSASTAEVIRHCREKFEVELDRYYPVLMHQQQPMVDRFLGQQAPGTEKQQQKLLQLPLHNTISLFEMKRVTEALYDIL